MSAILDGYAAVDQFLTDNLSLSELENWAYRFSENFDRFAGDTQSRAFASTVIALLHELDCGSISVSELRAELNTKLRAHIVQA